MHELEIQSAQFDQSELKIVKLHVSHFCFKPLQ